MNIQIITYDSYQTLPTPLDKRDVTFNGTVADSNLSVGTVPVFRIYGRLNTKHTCLVHIHNVFPYFYINFPKAKGWSSTKFNEENLAELKKWLFELNTSIAKSYKNNYKRGKKSKKPRRKQNKEANQSNTRSEHALESDSDPDSDLDSDLEEESKGLYHSYISDLSIISGIPFYGYHLQHSTFMKISMTSPRYVTRLAKLMTESKFLVNLYSLMNRIYRISYSSLLIIIVTL